MSGCERTSRAGVSTRREAGIDCSMARLTSSGEFLVSTRLATGIDCNCAFKEQIANDLLSVLRRVLIATTCSKSKVSFAYVSIRLAASIDCSYKHVEALSVTLCFYSPSGGY